MNGHIKIKDLVVFYLVKKEHVKFGAIYKPLSIIETELQWDTRFVRKECLTAKILKEKTYTRLHGTQNRRCKLSVSTTLKWK